MRRLSLSLLVAIALTGVLGGHTLSPPSARAQVHARYSGLRLSFEPNRGQAERNARFVSRGAGYTLVLGSAGAILALRSTRVSLRFLGANPHPRIEPTDRLPGVADYYFGSDPSRWRIGIPTYGAITYTGIYPGVDLVFHGTQGHFEYDWLLSPGADASRIRLQIGGARTVRLARDGNLIVHTAAGDLMQRAPHAYSRLAGHAVTVATRYAMLGHGIVGLRLGAYDRTQPLTIDPVLVYGITFGGTGQQESTAITADATGATYITGSTDATTFPESGPAGRTFSGGTCRPVLDPTAGCGDVFAVKLDPTGTYAIYSAVWGGSADQVGEGIAVDARGNAYVTGVTDSTDFPTKGAVMSSLGGGSPRPCVDPITKGPVPCADAFLFKLDPAGNLLASTYLGGPDTDIGWGVTVDGSSVYVAGQTYSTGFAGSGYPVTILGPGKGGGFVARLDTALLAIQHFTIFGGTPAKTGVVDSARAIIVRGGRAYVTGIISSDDFPTTQSAVQAQNVGVSSALVAILNSDGTTLDYATTLGGNAQTSGYGIDVEPSGAIVVDGTTTSISFPTTAGSLYPAPAAGNTGFVASISAAGTLQYSSYYPAQLHSVRFAGGNVVVGGSDNTGPLVVKLNSAFSVVYSIPITGGTFGALDVDPSSNIYVTGATLSAAQASGGSPTILVYVVKFQDVPPPTSTPTSTPIPPTATPTFTPIPPSPTPTFTPIPPTSTPTPTATQRPPTIKKKCSKHATRKHGKCACKKGYVKKHGKCVKKKK